MATLITLSIKQPDGKFKNYTISIYDQTDKYGNNVAMYEEQTKEEREAKAKKTYLGNGKVVWTNGSIEVAPKFNKVDSSPSVNASLSTPKDNLPLNNIVYQTNSNFNEFGEIDDLPF